MNNSEILDNVLHYGLMLQGKCITANSTSIVYLAYNDLEEKYYFDKNPFSKNISFFMDNNDGRFFFKVHQKEIYKAAEAVDLDPLHTNFSLVLYKPTMIETLPLTEFIRRPEKEKDITYYMSIHLYDHSPIVNEPYYIGYNCLEDKIVITKNFYEVELFPNREITKQFYLQKEDEIRELADQCRINGKYRRVDICIDNSTILPKRLFPIATIPPIPPVPPIPPRFH